MKRALAHYATRIHPGIFSGRRKRGSDLVKRRREIRSCQRTVPPGAMAQAHGGEQRFVIDRSSEACRAGSGAEITLVRSAGLCWRGQSLSRKTRPVKAWARVELATRCHAGMADHPLRRNLPSLQYVLQKDFQLRHLGLRKRVIATIVKLDADRAGIDVVHSSPFPCPGVPGAVLFPHHLPEPAVIPDQVMRRYLDRRITQSVQCGLRAVHGGIVNHHQLRLQTSPARPETGGRVPDGPFRIRGAAQFPATLRNGAGSQPQA